MSHALEQIAAEWGTSLWRATWQGGIAIAVVWALARFCTFLSPRVICWLWRMACLKLLIALVWVTPVDLPLLPARVNAPPAAKLVSPLTPDAAFEPLAIHQSDVAQPPTPDPAPTPISTSEVLLAAWIFGVVYCISRTMRQWHTTRELRRSSGRVADDLLRVCQDEGRRLGVGRLPRLQISARVESPMLIGIWRPTIILPDQIETTFDEAEVRLMMAHEMAHLKRHDLAWNWLPTAATWLFYFHPLVWILIRRWSESQEAACDELLIQRHAAQPSAYGRLLLKLSARAPVESQATFAAAGVLGAYRNLERRLLALARVRPFSARRLSVALAILLLAGAATVVPWRLTAQEPTKQTPNENLAPKDQANAKIKSADIESLKVPEPGTAKDPNTQRVITKLRELGAHVSVGRGDSLTVGIDLSWKGTAADLASLNELPKIRHLHIDLQDAKALRQEIAEAVEKGRSNRNLLDIPLKDVDAAAVGALKLKSPLKSLLISNLSDEALATMESLPACRSLMLSDCSLSEQGSQLLARMVDGIEELTLTFGPERPNHPSPNRQLSDSVLESFGQIRSLKKLDLFGVGITDAGLAHLAPLEKLESLGISQCPRVNGEGFASLASLKSLRQLIVNSTPITADGLKAIAGLSQLEALFLNSAELQPEGIDALGKLTNLRSLTINESSADNNAAFKRLPTGNAILRAVSRLPKLRGLSVYGLGVSDEGLDTLSGATQLENLFIGPVRLTDKGLNAFESLKNLQRLSIRGEGLTDAGLRHLAGIESLAYLQLEEGQITGTGLSALANLEKLKTLSIGNCPFDDQGSEALAALKSIEQLYITRTRITDRSIAPIAKLTHLRELTLSENEVTTEGLMQLHGLKTLRAVSAYQLKASKEEMAQLQAALPGVKISRQPDWVGSSYLYDSHHDDADAEEATNTFRSDSSEQKDTPERETESPQAASEAEQAVNRLKELGATPATLKQIGIQSDWKGTDADVSLVNRLPDLDWLCFDFEQHARVEAVRQVQRKQPIEFLILEAVSDAIVSKLDALPRCKTLLLSRYRLSNDGFRRLAQLAVGIDRLELMEPNPPANGISDDGLRHISNIHSLKGLRIFEGDISDDGLALLAGLDKLEELEFATCNKVQGSGYARLASIKSLRNFSAYDMRIESDGFRALTKLTHLKSLKIQPKKEPSKEEVTQLRAALPGVTISVEPVPSGLTGVFLQVGEEVAEDIPTEPPTPPAPLTIADWTTAIRQEPKRADLYVRRGQARALQNDMENAFADFDLALEVDPQSALALVARGEARIAQGDYTRAKADYESACRLASSDNPLSVMSSCNLAWLLATCPDEKVRDGRRAVELARKACEFYGWREHNTLDTFAAANAEAGDFDAAVKWQSEAINLAGDDKAFHKQAAERLALYRQGKPYREAERAK